MIYFFFNEPATTEIYTLSLHDALPISPTTSIPSQNDDVPRRTVRGLLLNRSKSCLSEPSMLCPSVIMPASSSGLVIDRKSTRLNSSHSQISYAVFCLKKKKKQ